MAGMKDVAKLCGVSIKSVSNVVNRSPHVSEELRRKVLEAIRSTGYAPNQEARSLVLKSPAPASQFGFRIGCVVKNWADSYDDPYCRLLFKGMEAEARRQGAFVAFVEEEAALMAEPAKANWLLSKRACDGIVSFVGPESALFEKISALPFVLSGSHPGFDCFAPAKAECMALAVGHLHALGHRRIGFAGAAGDERFDAWKAELAKRGLEDDKRRVFLRGFGFEAGKAAGAELLALKKTLRPSAVVCASDLVAIGFLHALNEGGVSVPDDISLCGCDDVPEASLALPPLTTVDVKAETLGALAAQALIERGFDPSKPVCLRSLPCELKIRRSAKQIA